MDITAMNIRDISGIISVADEKQGLSGSIELHLYPQI